MRSASRDIGAHGSGRSGDRRLASVESREPHVGAGALAEGDHGHPAVQPGPVQGVEAHERAVGPQSFGDGEFLAPQCVDPVEELDVRGVHVQDHGHRPAARGRDKGAISPGVAGADLVNGETRMGGACGRRDSGTPRWLFRLPGVANAPSAWARNVLAVVLPLLPGNRGHARGGPRSRRPAQVPQRVEGVPDDEAGTSAGYFAMHQRARGAGGVRRFPGSHGPSRGETPRAGEPRSGIPAQRDEQVARSEPARVDVDAADGGSVHRVRAERLAEFRPGPQDAVAHRPILAETTGAARRIGTAGQRRNAALRWSAAVGLRGRTATPENAGSPLTPRCSMSLRNTMRGIFSRALPARSRSSGVAIANLFVGLLLLALFAALVMGGSGGVDVPDDTALVVAPKGAIVEQTGTPDPVPGVARPSAGRARSPPRTCCGRSTGRPPTTGLPCSRWTSPTSCT